MKVKAVLILMIITGTMLVQAQGKTAEIKIKTSSQCEMCKERIEEALAFTKGVKKAELDLETRIVTVSYKKGKTDPAALRMAISKAGYDADDTKADKKAYEKLPACCKKPGDPGHEKHDK